MKLESGDNLIGLTSVLTGCVSQLFAGFSATRAWCLQLNPHDSACRLTRLLAAAGLHLPILLLSFFSYPGLLLVPCAAVSIFSLPLPLCLRHH